MFEVTTQGRFRDGDREGEQLAAAFLADADRPARRDGLHLRISVSWLFWLAALGIAVASTVAIVRLLDHADTRRRTQIVLAEINVVVSKLRLAEVRAAVEPSSRGEFVATTVWASTGLPPAIRGLLALDPDGDAADRVREAVEQYQSNASEHLELLAAGREEAAWQWEQERSGPSYALLQEATSQSGIFYSAQAVQSLRRVRWSAAGAMGSEALLIGLLAVLSTRARHAAKRRLLDERARHAARFEALVHHSADVVAVLDARGTIRYVSPSVEPVLGYRPVDLLRVSGFAFVQPDGLGNARAALDQVLHRPGDVLSLELPARHADGSARWIELSGRNLLADANVGGIVVNFRDVTGRRTLQDQLRHQALHDPLTKLANRKLFADLVEKALARARRQDAGIALLFLDLDGFKPVNDTLGHQAGDELLIEVARRLGRTIRPGDTAARVGGDEFAVLLDPADREDALAASRRVLEAIAAPVALAAGEVRVGASIGIAVGPAEGQSPEELLRQADVAMYLAKEKGKGRCEVFQQGLALVPCPASVDPERIAPRGIPGRSSRQPAGAPARATA